MVQGEVSVHCGHAAFFLGAQRDHTQPTVSCRVWLPLPMVQAVQAPQPLAKRFWVIGVPWAADSKALLRLACFLLPCALSRPGWAQAELRSISRGLSGWSPERSRVLSAHGVHLFLWLAPQPPPIPSNPPPPLGVPLTQLPAQPQDARLSCVPRRM